MKLTKDQKKKCNAIIHAASGLASGVGAGLAQVPCSDSAIITPIQLTMTIALGEVFDIELTQSAAYSAISSVAAATIGRAISQVLIGWIPGFGNAVNAATAAAITEALGWTLVHDFNRKVHASSVG